MWVYYRNFVFRLTKFKWWYTVVGCGEITHDIWFMELVFKHCWCCLKFDFMHKGKVIKSITFKYIQNIAFLKSLCGMCESIFTMYDLDG